MQHRRKKKEEELVCVPRNKNEKKIHSDQLHQFPRIIASPACSFYAVSLPLLFPLINALHTACEVSFLLFVFYVLNLINITKLQ